MSLRMHYRYSLHPREGDTLIPFAFFLALCGLEVAVSIIQAYVFVLLVISYIKDAIYLH